MQEKMYETGHDRGKVQRGADHSFEPTGQGWTMLSLTTLPPSSRIQMHGTCAPSSNGAVGRLRGFLLSYNV